MIEWASPLLSLIGGAVGAAFTGSVLSHFFQRRRYVEEQLGEKYSEFVAAATEEIDRARQLESFFAVGNPDGEEDKKWAADLIQQRDPLRRLLSRLRFQIALLETDPTLRDQAKRLVDDQPFILPGRFGKGNFDERFEKYKRDIAEYQRLLDSLAEGVLRKRGLL